MYNASGSLLDHGKQGPRAHTIPSSPASFESRQDLKRLESCVSWMRRLKVKPSPITLGHFASTCAWRAVFFFSFFLFFFLLSPPFKNHKQGVTRHPPKLETTSHPQNATPKFSKPTLAGGGEGCSGLLSALERALPTCRISGKSPGILVKTYGQAGDLDKVLAAWDEMEERAGIGLCWDV